MSFGEPCRVGWGRRDRDLYPNFLNAKPETLESSLWPLHFILFDFLRYQGSNPGTQLYESYIHDLASTLVHKL